jgi:hypothetical protein
MKTSNKSSNKCVLKSQELDSLRKQQAKLVRDLIYIKNLCDHADEHCSWQNAIEQIKYVAKNGVESCND